MDRCPVESDWSLWIDGEGDLAGDMDGHLAGCAACRGTVESLREADRSVRNGCDASGPSESPCPPVEEILSWVSEGLSPGGRGIVEDHLASCEACCHLVAGTPGRPVEVAFPARGRPWRWAAAAACLAAASAAWFAGGTRSDDLSRPGTVTASVASVLTLRDGTSISLAAGSRLADLPPREGERRRVRLESGAVEVRVPPGAQGFVLQTDAAGVRVVGTRFAVRCTRIPGVGTGGEEPAVAVHVLEGKVRVETDAGSETVGAGRRAYAVAGGPVLVQDGEAIRDDAEAARLREDYLVARAEGRDVHARWIAAILVFAGRDVPALPREGEDPEGRSR